MKQSPQRARNLVSSIVGTIQNSPPSRIHDHQRHTTYGRLSGDDDENGDVEAQQELPTLHSPHNHNDFQEFTIDDEDDEEYRSTMNGEEEYISTNHHAKPDITKDYCYLRGSTTKPPHNYICPLTLKLMEDPVHDGCGHTFERQAIVDWLEHHSQTSGTNSRNEQEIHPICPISRKPLVPFLHQQSSCSDGNAIENATQELHCDCLLKRDPELQQRIQDWKTNHPTYSARRHRPSVLEHHDCSRMLLPQEQRVLKIVQTRARIRSDQIRRSQCRYNCVLGFVILTGVVLVILSYVMFIDDGHQLGGK